VAEKLASVRAVVLPVLEMGDDRDRTLELLLEQGELAVDHDGADTLVLGCMSMGFQMVAGELSEALGVPVVNPAVVCVKAAEMLVGAGLAHSKRAYMTPPKM
jgi:allantoin racemase